MEDFVADYDSLASNSFETLFYGTCYPAIEYDGEKVKTQSLETSTGLICCRYSN
jgi:hypothetical protein